MQMMLRMGPAVRDGSTYAVAQHAIEGACQRGTCVGSPNGRSHHLGSMHVFAFMSTV